MAIVPKPIVERVQFYQRRMKHFATHAAAIGLSAAEVADMQAKTDAAHAAYLTQQEAMRVAQGKTRTLEAAMAAMSAAGAKVIARIRASAGEHREIYHQTFIPKRAAKSPLAEPGTPFRFSTAIDARGSVKLTWSCKHPRGAQGTLYRISRRVASRGAFEHLGTVGKKTFTDTTIPAGATSIDYRVQAVRSRKTGSPAHFNVSFGTNQANPQAPATHPRLRAARDAA